MFTWALVVAMAIDPWLFLQRNIHLSMTYLLCNIYINNMLTLEQFIYKAYLLSDATVHSFLYLEFRI